MTLKEERRERYQNDSEYRERVKRYNRAQRFKHDYGITIDQYDQKLEEQKGLCAICEKPCKTGARLVVDHNHETGEFRGLLCRGCNLHIGHLERKEWVEKALRYLNGC